jgi:putative transposase
VFDSCRFVWNQALGRWGDLWRQERISLSYVAACKELTDWRSRFEWLAEQPSTPQQQVLRDLYRAIAAFFNKSNPVGRPRFKSRKAGYATARWTKCGFAVSGSGLGLPDDRLEVGTSAGRIRLRVVWSRPLPSPPSSATVYRDPAGRWWASFVVRIEAPAQPLPLTGQATGLDLGLATFATTCDAESDIPRYPQPAAGAGASSGTGPQPAQVGSHAAGLGSPGQSAPLPGPDRGQDRRPASRLPPQGGPRSSRRLRSDRRRESGD